MSGHSHFSSIKHKKAITDAKRGQIFSKLARQISIAAKEGDDPEMNPQLRQSLDKAKSLNMPKDNIERAIKKGTGELNGIKLESVIFEAYGPGNIAIIIEGITDNKNRALAEVKQILNQNNGKLAQSGSVKWLFERKGVLEIKIEHENKEEDLELLAIEAGAEDISWYNSILNIYTKPEKLEKVKINLENKGIKAETSSLDWVAKDMIEIKKKESTQRLFEALDELDTVQEIYSNIKI